MGFVRLKMKQDNTDTVFDTFINTNAIEFITAYRDGNGDYVITAEVKFNQSDRTFWIVKYIILGETMESIAKKLGLEDK